MEDERAQFLILVADACGAAALSGLPVELKTSSGETIVGVPCPPDEAEGADAVDDTGYAPDLRIGDRYVRLEGITSITVPGRT
jgi:hypothetical protein